MDLGTIFLAIAIGGALWCAWMIVSDATPHANLLDTVAICLDWEPPKGIHADISICRCDLIRVTLTSDSEWELSTLLAVTITPGESRVVIHDRLDDAADEFQEAEDDFGSEDYERIINRNWEAN